MLIVWKWAVWIWYVYANLLMCKKWTVVSYLINLVGCLNDTCPCAHAWFLHALGFFCFSCGLYQNVSESITWQPSSRSVCLSVALAEETSRCRGSPSRTWLWACLACSWDCFWKSPHTDRPAFPEAHGGTRVSEGLMKPLQVPRGCDKSTTHLAFCAYKTRF